MYISIVVVIRKDCQELKANGISTSGIYTINPDGGVPFKVSCKISTDI